MVQSSLMPSGQLVTNDRVIPNDIQRHTKDANDAQTTTGMQMNILSGMLNGFSFTISKI